MINESQLTLKNLEYHAPHGYYESEQREGNDFEVDLVFRADLREAGKNDELDQTINYEKAEAIVSSIMKGSPVKLIETLASRIGASLVEAFPEATALEVRVRKLNPPIDPPCQYSEVSMTWKKS